MHLHCAAAAAAAKFAKIIEEISAKNISDMGRVMALVMKKGDGKVDGGIANRIARELLQ